MSSPEQIADGFRDLARALESGRELLDPATDVLTKYVKAAAPVRSGKLRASLHGEIRGAARSAVTSSLVYASIVDRRQHFVDKGVERAQGELDRVLAEAGDELLSQVGK